MTSTPPAWKWLDECEVPGQVYQHMTSETSSEAELSIHSRKVPDFATLRKGNDSNPDPTYQDCWPSERYLSDGPDDGDQCSECRSAPGQPHASGCDSDEAVISCGPVISCDRKDDATGCKPDLKDAVRRLYYAAHWTPDRDVDERQLWEDVRDAAGFEPGRAPECESAAQLTDSVINVESCPECGAVTDIDYGPASVLLPKRESGAAEETCIDDNPLLNHMECTFNSCMDTAVAKNEGYAGSADPMANFNDSVRLGVPVPIGVAIRLSDKWARLCRLLQTGENPLADESITDTIMDSINYLAILLYALSPATASQDEDTALHHLHHVGE